MPSEPVQERYKMLKNNKAESMIGAIFVLMTIVLTIAVMILVLGTILDTYIFELQRVGFSTSNVFYDAMNSVMTLGVSFYYLPTIFLMLISVWFFKVIIGRHKYTRGDEEEW